MLPYIQRKKQLQYSFFSSVVPLNGRLKKYSTHTHPHAPTHTRSHYLVKASFGCCVSFAKLCRCFKLLVLITMALRRSIFHPIAHLCTSTFMAVLSFSLLTAIAHHLITPNISSAIPSSHMNTNNYDVSENENENGR